MADNKFLRKKQALERLRKMPAVIRSVAREAVDQEAAFLVEAIRPNIPKEEGHLAQSLEWHRNPRGDKISVVITEGRNQEDDPKNRKARAVEFGRGGENPMEPQPHFFPTYRAHKRKMQNRIQKRIRETIRRIWGVGG